jgi:hypothetical protein
MMVRLDFPIIRQMNLPSGPPSQRVKQNSGFLLLISRYIINLTFQRKSVTHKSIRLNSSIVTIFFYWDSYCLTKKRECPKYRKNIKLKELSLDLPVRIILLLAYSGLVDGSFYKQHLHPPTDIKRTLESLYDLSPSPTIHSAVLRAQECS